MHIGKPWRTRRMLFLGATVRVVQMKREIDAIYQRGQNWGARLRTTSPHCYANRSSVGAVRKSNMSAAGGACRSKG